MWATRTSRKLVHTLVTILLCSVFESYAKKVRVAQPVPSLAPCVKMIFFHVPKTGGTTIDDFLSQVLRAHHFVIDSPTGLGISESGWESFVNKEMENPLAHPRRYLSLHAISPPAITLLQDIQKLKHAYTANSCKHLFFTVFRNPISAAKSAYGFYLGGSRMFTSAPFSWERYESLFVPNFQAQFWLTPQLFHASPEDAKWKEDPNFTAIKQSNINPIFDIMHAIDLVGVTEELPNFLGYIASDLGFNVCRFRSANRKSRIVEAENATLNEITRRVCSLDQQLYDLATTEWERRWDMKCAGGSCRPCISKPNGINVFN